MFEEPSSSWFGFKKRAVARALRLSAGILFLCSTSALLQAQETTEPPTEEVVANLAAGRVIVAVVKDAIIVGTVENPIEPETRPPVPVQLGSRRTVIALGAVDWFSPASQERFARFDRDVPRMAAARTKSGPTMQQMQENAEASDIEAIGEGATERLKGVVKELHSKVNVRPGEPLVMLVVADYMPGYGPEVWQITMTIQQEPVRLDYLDTRVLPPHYLQFWPPEKGHPHTLVEFNYPPEGNKPTLVELLSSHDPRLEGIRKSDAKMAQLADEFARGESAKIPSAEAVQFLRAAMNAIAPPNGRETVATIDFEKGFEWVLRPPPEPQRPGEQKQERPPGAPSLLNPPSSH